MKVLSVNDINAVLAGLPAGIPMDNAGVQKLMQLAQDARVEMQPFHYPVSFTAVAVGSTPAAQQFQIDASAPFMLISQQFFAAGNPVVQQTESTLIVPACTVQIQDLQSNRNWQNGGVPVWAIFGNARQPYYYPQPRLIAANSSVSVSITSQETVDDFDLTLVFSGYRFYQA